MRHFAIFLAFLVLAMGNVSAQQIRTNVFPSLNFQNAITEIRGDGSKKIAIFADPHDCPECTKLAQKLLSLDNITIYTFLYSPAQNAGKDKELLDEARKIWCSDDPLITWKNFSLRNIAPPALNKEQEKNCDSSALLDNQNFGARNDIKRTPTTFLPNGKRLTGVLTDRGIADNLSDRGKKKKKIRSPHRFNFD